MPVSKATTKQKSKEEKKKALLDKAGGGAKEAEAAKNKAEADSELKAKPTAVDSSHYQISNKFINKCSWPCSN